MPRFFGDMLVFGGVSVPWDLTSILHKDDIIRRSWLSWWFFFTTFKGILGVLPAPNLLGALGISSYRNPIINKPKPLLFAVIGGSTTTQSYGDYQITHDLGGGFSYFLFSPRNSGKSSNLTDIFQMGWFNHQLVIKMPVTQIKDSRECHDCVFLITAHIPANTEVRKLATLEGRLQLFPRSFFSFFFGEKRWCFFCSQKPAIP